MSQTRTAREHASAAPGRAGATRVRPARRDVDGILLLDKPVGLTSNAALQQVKRLFNARKAGHTGSLDPLASGLLPICFGNATKLSSYLLGADKRYRFTCRLGAVTSTGDAEGEVVRQLPVPALQRADVERALSGFVGEIDQLPPMYSALKHQGRRLYELARQGIEVERQPRRVTIRELRLLGLDGDTLECVVRCSKGTYVRTLAEDIGKALGSGGYLVALRRELVDPFGLDDAVTLEALERTAGIGGRPVPDAPGGRDAGGIADSGSGADDGSGEKNADRGRYAALDDCLLPADRALSDWPEVRLDATLSHYLRCGSPVRVAGAPAAGWLRLYDAGQAFIGVGEILPDGRVAPRRLFGGA